MSKDILEKELLEIALGNLSAWKASGIVKLLRYYSADDNAVCVECQKHSGRILTPSEGDIGTNLPPLNQCRNARCRCYFRPWDISFE